MGSQKCRIVGKSQSVLMMINPMISTRTRMHGGLSCRLVFVCVWGGGRVCARALAGCG
jgi:hypothetical protein